MGRARTDLSSATARRWAGPAVDGSAPRPERRVVGPPDGGALARPARPLSAVSNLSSAFSAMATLGSPRSAAAAARRGPARPRPDRSVGSLRGCDLRRREKGGAAVGPTRRGKGSKIMAICDRHGLPLAVHVASASPYEPHLVPATLDARFLPELPRRLIGDRGYDSDGLDEQLRTTYGIEMIAAHRKNRRRTHDGRPLRRAKRRWKIERLFAWLHNSRRLVTRWEYHVENFLGLLQLACARILLRHL